MEYPVKKKKEIIDYSKYEITPEGGRYCYYYAHYLIIAQYRYSGWQLRDVIAIGEQQNHETKWFFAYEPQVMVQYLLDFLRNPECMHEIEDSISSVRKETVDHMRTIVVSELTMADLSRELAYFYEGCIRQLCFATTLRYLDRGVLGFLREHTLDGAVANELIRTISAPTRLSFGKQEEQALLQAVSDIISGKSTRAVEARRLCEGYCWSSLGYYNEQPKGIAFYEQALDELIPNNPIAQASALNERFRVESEEREHSLKTLDERLRRIAYIASESAYLKDYFKFSINEFQYQSEKLFVEASKRTSVSVATLKDLSPDEVRGLLAGKSYDESVLRERIRHNVIACDTKQTEQFVGAEADDFGVRYLHYEQLEPAYSRASQP